MRACGFADLIHAALPYIAESKVAETTKGLKEATLFQMGFKGRDGEQRMNAAAAASPPCLACCVGAGLAGQFTHREHFARGIGKSGGAGAEAWDEEAAKAADRLEQQRLAEQSKELSGWGEKK